VTRESTRHRIASHLREQIGSGELASGVELPGARSLALRYGCVRSTAAAAIVLLVADGLVEVSHGLPPRVVEADDSPVALANAALLAQLAVVATDLLDVQARVEDLIDRRREIITTLFERGVSYARMAEPARVSRGRVYQIHHSED
jgi:DNA-binding FadR family transcriptional regulator